MIRPSADWIALLGGVFLNRHAHHLGTAIARLCICSQSARLASRSAAIRDTVCQPQAEPGAMTFAGINFVAVGIAALAAWLASAAWYMSLSRIYTAALGKTPAPIAEGRKRPGAMLPFLYALIGNIVIAWMLAGVLGHLGAGQVTLRNGVISAAFLWFGFILTTMTVNFSFSGRDWRLLLIDLANWLIVMLVCGAVVGGIGV
jgi:hypothetical protein